MLVTENDFISLIRYTHADDYDMFRCWNDTETQRGYNGIFSDTFQQFSKLEIEKYKFWVTIVDKATHYKVGTLRLGLDELCPDLAIWIYPQFRGKGYGTQAFCLALKYLFNRYDYAEISAGCHIDNEKSLRLLNSAGFTRYPQGDVNECNCFTGESTKQLEFRITAEQLK